MPREVLEDVIRDTTGNVVQAVSVTIYEAGGLTKATVYADKTTPTPLPNSLTTTDASGRFRVFLDTADYPTPPDFKYIGQKAGYSDWTRDDIHVLEEVVGSGEAALLTTYNITADAVWENTGLSIVLPTVGKYKVQAKVRAEATLSGATGNILIEAKFYNVTRAQDIVYSQTLIHHFSREVTSGTTVGGGTVVMSSPVTTIGANETIALYARTLVGGSTVDQRQIASDIFGYTGMEYLMI